MDGTFVQTLVWVAAGGLLLMILMRRRNRKSVR
jgi:hypothetical protein